MRAWPERLPLGSLDVSSPKLVLGFSQGVARRILNHRKSYPHDRIYEQHI